MCLCKFHCDAKVKEKFYYEKFFSKKNRPFLGTAF